MTHAASEPQPVWSPRDAGSHETPDGDLAAIRVLLTQSPEQRFLTLARAARFFAAVERD